jgi:type IV secretory pathway TraG/TraD family ATPase VirD4
MLSQPMTKIFLKTSEPNAAEWISKAIGEIKIERYRETRSHGQFPESRSTASQQYDISCEPLVMASEISGLEPLQGFLKHGNYVVRLQVPYLDLKKCHEKYIERKIDPQGECRACKAISTAVLPNGPQGMEVNPPTNGPQLFFE